MFKRRRSAEDEPVEDDLLDPEAPLDEADLDDEAPLDDEADDLDEDEDEDGSTPEPASLTPRDNGPFDESEVYDDLERIDLGALRVHPADGVEVRLEIDEGSGTVQAVTLLVGDTAMQVGVFAAPRTEGIWEEVRTQIAAGITSSGGTVDHAEGEFGPELKAKVAGEDDKGKRVLQPVRFVGVDGPRWFLRGLLSGPGVDDASAAEPLLETFRALVVVRGTDPMAPHEPLTIVLPREVGADDTPPDAAGQDLNPFRRGPEITEIR